LPLSASQIGRLEITGSVAVDAASERTVFSISKVRRFDKGTFIFIDPGGETRKSGFEASKSHQESQKVLNVKRDLVPNGALNAQSDGRFL
jgi:hypothetical protein